MIRACKPKNVVLRYKIMSKCVEGDSCLQKPTGIRRHRLRTLFGGGDEGNTLEQTDWTRNSVGLYGSHTLRAWVGKDTDHECFVVLFFSMRVVPRNNIKEHYFVLGYKDVSLGRFLLFWEFVPSRTLQHFMQKECTKQWKWWPV